MLVEEEDERLREVVREARRFLWRVVFLTLFFVGMIVVSVASAETALYRVSAPDASIVLYMEPCALPEITNLRRRAVWTEKGKGTEGCWAVTQWQTVLMYFSDRTVVAIPQQYFTRVTGA